MILTLLSSEGFRSWEAEEVNLEGVVANGPTHLTLHREEEITHCVARGKGEEGLDFYNHQRKNKSYPLKLGLSTSD